MTELQNGLLLPQHVCHPKAIRAKEMQMPKEINESTPMPEARRLKFGIPVLTKSLNLRACEFFNTSTLHTL